MVEISFFARPAAEVAHDLVGRTLVRLYGSKHLKIVVTEVAAHEGGSATAARRGMQFAPGTIFVMPFRGRTFLNIATGREGDASCVWIRAGIAEEGGGRVILDGPMKLSAYLEITKSLDGCLLGSELLVEGEGVSPALVCESKPEGTAGNCVGVYRLRA